MGCGASNDAKGGSKTEKEERYDGVVSAPNEQNEGGNDRSVKPSESKDEVTVLTPVESGEKEKEKEKSSKDAVDDDYAPVVPPAAEPAAAAAPPGTTVTSPEQQQIPGPAALNPIPAAANDAARPEPSTDTTVTPPSDAPMKPPGAVSSLPAEVINDAHFTLLHFNDVYHIAPGKKEPVGGASRFAHKVKEYKQAYNAELYFSGDAYNPSLMSTVTKGKHMVPVLNALDMKCAVYGNHDFDFGEPVLKEFTAQSNAPWLMSNVLDTSRDMKPAADGLLTFTYNHPAPGYKNGHVKIGVIGLAEEEWLTCVKDLPPELKYFDAVETGRKLATQLKKEEGCELVIALTHMRVNNDRSFALGCPEVDIVFGGHDHFYSAEHLETGQLLVKSGTDFKNLSFITVKMKEKGAYPECHVERIDITKDVPEDPELSRIVSSYEDTLQEKIGKELCHLETTADVTTEAVRTAEAGMGNLVTDIMKQHCDAELAFVNSGILRADIIYRPCTLTLKDLLDIVPIEDVIVKIEITGERLLKTLENGLSKYPQQEGRFLQMSGVELIADPAREPGDRIIQLKVNGKLVDKERTYTAATTEFLTKGCDGFTALKGVKYLIDGENGFVLPTLVRQAIEAMVPSEARMSRKESIAGLQQALRKGSMQYKNAAQEVKRSYLPTIRPVIEGRINLSGKVPPPGSRPASAASRGSMLRAPKPMERDRVRIIPDAEEARRLFQEAAVLLPSAKLVWTPDVARYVGRAGTIVTTYEEGPGLAQVKFTDGETHWFPADCLSDGAFVASTPATPLAGNLQRTISVNGEAAHIPKERTLSVIMQPLNGAHGAPASKVGLDERGRLQIDATEVMSTVSASPSKGGKSKNDMDDDIMSWSAGSLDAPPRICALVWADDFDAVKNLLKDSRTREYVNSRVGSDDVGEISPSYGLGLGANTGAYPLHFAVAKGNLRMVKLLLDYNAQRDVRAHNGFTPREVGCARLTVALCKGRKDVAERIAAVLNTLECYRVPQRPAGGPGGARKHGSTSVPTTPVDGPPPHINGPGLRH